MDIFVNAVALKVAGAKSVLANFLGAIKKEGYGHTYHFFLPRDPIYEQYENLPHIKLYRVHPLVNKFYFRYFIDHHYLRIKLNAIQPDVIFSMGNIALPVTTIPQVLLFHIPQILYPESDYWNRVGARKRFFRLLNSQIANKFKFAAVVAAQTEVAKVRLGRLFGLDGKVVVIPNAVSLNNVQRNIPKTVPPHFAGLEEKLAGNFVFICLSRYYEHKNIEILVEVAEKIKQSGQNYKILITIEKNQRKGAELIINEIEKRGLKDVLINLGVVRMEDIAYLYNISNALLLPTLMESFSGTYLEAAYYKRPVFTSNYDFARDVLGEDAVYFNPLDSDEIFNSLNRIKDNEFIDRITARAFEKIKTYPTWTEVARSYVQLLEDTAKKHTAHQRHT